MSNTKVYFICFWLITESGSEVNWTFNLKDKFKTQVSQFCDFGILSLKYTPGVYPLNLWATLGRVCQYRLHSSFDIKLSFFVYLSSELIIGWKRGQRCKLQSLRINIWKMALSLNVYTKINIDTLVILCKLIKPLM